MSGMGGSIRQFFGRLHLIDPCLYLPEFKGRIYGASGDNSQEKMDGIFRAVESEFGRDPHVVIHRMTSEQAAARIEEDSLDLVYID